MIKGCEFDIEWEYETDDGTVFVNALGRITDYYEATMYRANGDPGDPEEGGEVEIDKIACVDENGNAVEFDESLEEELIAYICENA